MWKRRGYLGPCRSGWWNRSILQLLEHKLYLGNFIVPSAAAQEPKQRVIDGQRLFLLTELAMCFSRLLAELHQLIGFLHS